MTGFKPLDFGRLLDADDELDVYEYAVLNAMARGTDNASFKVRRSLSAIAKAAKVKKHQTVSEIIERPHVARYLERVERGPRRVDVWLRRAPHGRGTDMTAPAPEVEPGEPLEAFAQVSRVLEKAEREQLLEMDSMTEETDVDMAAGVAKLHLEEARELAVELYKRLDSAHQSTAHIISNGFQR